MSFTPCLVNQTHLMNTFRHFLKRYFLFKCIVITFHFNSVYTITLYILLQAKHWIVLFNSLAGECEGYKKSNITPYMHVMTYHMPILMQKHGGVKKFTGQGKIVHIISNL